VAAIQSDAIQTRVPVYEYPFVHEQLYCWVAARARSAYRRIVPGATGELPHSAPLRVHTSISASAARFLLHQLGL
jgi:hypothetical protein